MNRVETVLFKSALNLFNSKIPVKEENWIFSVKGSGKWKFKKYDKASGMQQKGFKKFTANF